MARYFQLRETFKFQYDVPSKDLGCSACTFNTWRRFSVKARLKAFSNVGWPGPPPSFTCMMPCPCATMPPRFVTTGIFLGCHCSPAAPIMLNLSACHCESTRTSQTSVDRCQELLSLLDADRWFSENSASMVFDWTGCFNSDLWTCSRFTAVLRRFECLAQDQLQRQYGFIYAQCRQFLSGMAAC